MPNIDKWAGDSFPLATWLDDVDLGVDTARLIDDKQTSITAVRNGVAQTAQTVRIESLRSERTIQTAGGETAVIDTVVIGYKGHPTITDTDLQRGDRFIVSGQQYEIMLVMPGEVNSLQAFAKVRN